MIDTNASLRADADFSEPSRSSALPDGNRRVLVVDDNEAIHDDFRKILISSESQDFNLDALEAEIFQSSREPRGLDIEFEVDSAYQGEAALECVRASIRDGNPYALVFMDVRMPPGWNGVDTTVRILEEDPDVAVVICTAYSDHNWDDWDSAFGQTDRVLILKKPFDAIEVRQLAIALQRRWELSQLAARNVADLEDAVRARTGQLTAANRNLMEEISLREKMEEELQMVQKLESIGRLASGIAHELNTPIQYVSDNIHFVRDAFADVGSLLETLLEWRKTIKRSLSKEQLVDALQRADVDYLKNEIPLALRESSDGIERVASIVHAMKDFSHRSRGKEPADLNAAIQTALTVARNEWKYVADVETALDPNLPLVKCLLGEFNQAILNIIVNAAHAIIDALGEASQEKGKIVVSTKALGEWVEVRISDTGIGMSEDVKARIFDPFFTTKKVGRGTGQGLSIAYTALVKKHGGTIDVESEPGRGTCFIVRLPVEAIEVTDEHVALSPELFREKSDS